MVSKRKPALEDEPGPSKKRSRTEKVKEEQELTSSKPKKVKKAKVVESVQPEEEQHENIEEEVEDDPEEETILVTKKAGPVTTTTLLKWPVEHMSELLRRIEYVLPQRDSLLYKSRVDRLNWNEIAFGEYSGAECRFMWDSIQKRVRRFRILRELVDDAKHWLTKPWTDFYRGTKNNRHPDMPRRPLSSYMIFYLSKKDKVLKEYPGLEMTGLSKHIAEMYNKLSPKAKEKYNTMAHAQRKEYEEKLEEFYRLHPEYVTLNTKTNVASGNDLIPKKPPTPFKLYCEDRLKQYTYTTDGEKNTFLEQCKEQWRTMSDKKKVCWINWAFEKEVKYQEDLKKYKAEHPDYNTNVAKSVLTKEERTIRERMAGKPEKPPSSAYSLFSRLMLASKDFKNVSPKDRMMVISQQWKTCSELEKKEYNLRVKHMIEQYKLQYAEYLESLPEDKRQEELQNNQPRKKKTQKVKQAESVGVEIYAKPAEPPKKGKKRGRPHKKVNMNKASKSKTLCEGEPEPPPATPFLLFAKSYQATYPDRKDAHEVWESMTNEQKNIHRAVLMDLKNVYIESYENFLKGLTPEQLKHYSELKKTMKLSNDSDRDSDDSRSDSEDECSSDSDKSAVKNEDEDSSDD